MGDDGGCGEVEERYIHLIGLEDNGGSGNYINMSKAMEKLRSATLKQKREKIACASPQGRYDEELRKVAEKWFRGENIEINMYSPMLKVQKKHTRNEAKEDNVTGWQTVRRRGPNPDLEKIVIAQIADQDKTTYANLLRHIETKVNLEEIGVRVRNMKETKGGNIVLTAVGKR